MLKKIVYILKDFFKNIRVGIENNFFANKISKESRLRIGDYLIYGPYSMLRNYIPISEIILENIKSKAEMYIYSIKNKSKDNPIVLLDVGANIGIYSLAFSEIGNAKVYSLEPFADSYHFLKKNISSNNVNNVKAFNFGLSDKKQELTMGQPSSKKSFFGLWSNSDSLESGCKTIYHENEGTLCSFIKGDNLVKKIHFDDIDYIKIDTEGSEFIVLNGLGDILLRFSPILQIELNMKAIENSGFSLNDMINFLIQHDYKSFILFGESLDNKRNINTLLSHPIRGSKDYIFYR